VRSAKRRSYGLYGTIVGVWCSCILAAGVLALVSRPSEVRVNLQTRQISFSTSDAEEELFTDLPMSLLRLTGYGSLDLGSGELRSGVQTILPAGSRVVIHPSGLGGSVGFPDVRFAGIRVPPRSVLTLVASEDEPLNLKVDIAANAKGGFELGPDVQFDCEGCQTAGHPQLPALMRFLPSGRHRVVFSGSGSGTIMMARLQRSENLSQTNIDIREPLGFAFRNSKKLESAVVGKGGTIELPELNRTIKVEAGEYVEIGEISKFVVRSIELADGLQVKLHGKAGRLASGPMRGVSDRLPSYLEWLWSREPLRIALSAAALAATTVLAILRKAKIMKEE
jgi:hypothetical protein